MVPARCLTADHPMHGRAQVCGSAEDSENLLLCDSEGCDGAYHISCLRKPLAAVPEGEWFCEQCEERSAVGGELRSAKSLVIDNVKRWRRRVKDASSSAELALVLGALESAVRSGDLAYPKAAPNSTPGLPRS